MNILNSISKGEVVSYASAVNYENNISSMIEEVNSMMTELNAKENLIGNNPLSVMYDNHSNHAKFMVNIFKMNDYELLKNTLKWVFRSYESRGFKSEYFQKAIEIWIKVIEKTLNMNASSEIIKIYEWIKRIQHTIEEENRDEKNESHYPFDLDWEENKNKFVDLLLKGNTFEALSLSKSIVHDRKSLEEFYTKIVTYSMYEIGAMWEKGLISVAQEHLATSIVMRLMASLYMNFILLENTKGKAIVTASINEYHVIGARIIADLLELDGWDVNYIGANVPNEDLIKTIKEEKPDFISISVTMSYNINNVINLISEIRTHSDLDYVKIMVGGYIFTYDMDSKEKIKADKIVLSSYDTIETARNWWNDKYESI